MDRNYLKRKLKSFKMFISKNLYLVNLKSIQFFLGQ